MPKRVEVSEETWDKLRIEYISSPDTSMRGLQRKYGIPFNAIKKRVDNEDWNKQRDEFRTTSMRKSLDLVSDFMADECSRAFRIANKVMNKLEECVDNIDVTDDYAMKNLKSITSAIKDLKEIGIFRSSLDQAEQEARIKKLQKDAEEEQTDTTITVIIDDELKSYCR